jgi:hypothetical protein
MRSGSQNVAYAATDVEAAVPYQNSECRNLSEYQIVPGNGLIRINKPH